jgi:hypothetical protein
MASGFKLNIQVNYDPKLVMRSASINFNVYVAGFIIWNGTNMMWKEWTGITGILAIRYYCW